MTAVVELVAHAIANNIRAALPDGTVVDYEYAARAAIWAMREPSEGMRLAAICAVQEADDGAGESWDYVDEVWMAMIGATLGGA